MWIVNQQFSLFFSRLFSTPQTPVIGVFAIFEKYRVMVQWIMGRSEQMCLWFRMVTVWDICWRDKSLGHGIWDISIENIPQGIVKWIRIIREKPLLELDGYRVHYFLCLPLVFRRWVWTRVAHVTSIFYFKLPLFVPILQLVLSNWGGTFGAVDSPLQVESGLGNCEYCDMW